MAATSSRRDAPRACSSASRRLARRSVASSPTMTPITSRRTAAMTSSRLSMVSVRYGFVKKKSNDSGRGDRGDDAGEPTAEGGRDDHDDGQDQRRVGGAEPVPERDEAAATTIAAKAPNPATSWGDSSSTPASVTRAPAGKALHAFFARRAVLTPSSWPTCPRVRAMDRKVAATAQRRRLGDDHGGARRGLETDAQPSAQGRRRTRHDRRRSTRRHDPTGPHSSLGADGR